MLIWHLLYFNYIWAVWHWQWAFAPREIETNYQNKFIYLTRSIHHLSFCPSEIVTLIWQNYFEAGLIVYLDKCTNHVHTLNLGGESVSLCGASFWGRWKPNQPQVQLRRGGLSWHLLVARVPAGWRAAAPKKLEKSRAHVFLENMVEVFFVVVLFFRAGR